MKGASEDSLATASRIPEDHIPDHDPGVDPETATMIEFEEERAAEEDATFEEELVKHVKGAKAWLFASILVTLFIALIASVMTDSSMAYAFLGFGPTIITVLIFIGLLEGEYKDVLFWLTPITICFLFLVGGPVLNQFVGDQLDIPVLTGTNIVLSYIILAVMSMIEYRSQKEVSLEDLEEFKPEQLDQYIHTIEDKCKALNFVIGRVYRASHGGTAELRNKIKIPSEWYNEFNSIPAEEVEAQRGLALDLLHRIKEQLSNLLRPEKNVFTAAEVKALKQLARDPAGKDRVLDVLSVNDNDPVQDYYLGAMDFCKRITGELEK